MKIFLGADHRGFELKNQIVAWLQANQVSVSDFGAHEYDAEDDYNDCAKSVAKALLAEPAADNFGILVCGSAQGVAMQANRFKGIRASICHTEAQAIETRSHNNANILCISADEDSEHFEGIIRAFLSTAPLTDNKYIRRNQKLDED